jgi:hypothetical protein
MGHAGVSRHLPTRSSALFTLKDLGGPKAVLRWVTLNRTYSDAANAVLVRSRVPANPTRRIIELGAAIEQYVSTMFADARARGRAKTSWTRRQQPDAAALARPSTSRPWPPALSCS